MRVPSLLAVAALAALIAGPAAAQQTVRAGSTPTGVPFTFLDTKTNTIEGMMVDVANAMGKAAGFQVQVEPMAFSALIGALTSNRIDVISAAMSITEPRKQIVDFSDPIYTYGEGLIVPKSDTTDYTNLDAFKGGVIGAQVGTNYLTVLQKSGTFSEVKGYETLQDIMSDVNAGRIKAGVGDMPILAYQLQQGRFPGVRLVRTYQPMVTGDLGIVVRKGDTELLKKVNAGLATIKADGTLDKILVKWGLRQ